MNAEKIEKALDQWFEAPNGVKWMIPKDWLPYCAKAIETALQQEAKALTVKQMIKICRNQFGNVPLTIEMICASIHAALPPESERIRELEDKYTELAQFDNLRLQKLQAERNAFESKIARAIEILKKPYKFDQGALIKLFRDIAEAIQILEAKNE